MRNRLASIAFTGLAAVGLAGCSTPVPDSTAGVGFQDYGTYEAQREAVLNGGVGAGVPVAPSGAEFSTERLGAAIDRAQGIAAPIDAMPATGAPLDAIGAAQAAQAPVAPDNVGMSDEQDFGAVAARETIQSDAERLAQNRAQYQVVAPTDLPERKGSTGPNIVQFAISTTHDVGTQMYRRSSLSLTSVDAACARYASSDLAQQAFLEAGGPERDRKGLDPDGDGFACGWDPRPFRAAVQ